eukprot:scaffold287_cov337-Pavlova_lutheri.AAC.237
MFRTNPFRFPSTPPIRSLLKGRETEPKRTRWTSSSHCDSERTHARIDLAFESTGYGTGEVLRLTGRRPLARWCLHPGGIPSQPSIPDHGRMRLVLSIAFGRTRRLDPHRSTVRLGVPLAHLGVPFERGCEGHGRVEGTSDETDTCTREETPIANGGGAFIALDTWSRRWRRHARRTRCVPMRT